MLIGLDVSQTLPICAQLLFFRGQEWIHLCWQGWNSATGGVTFEICQHRWSFPAHLVQNRDPLLARTQCQISTFLISSKSFNVMFHFYNPVLLICTFAVIPLQHEKTENLFFVCCVRQLVISTHHDPVHYPCHTTFYNRAYSIGSRFTTKIHLSIFCIAYPT